jgi:pyrroline-5-carboxylate reductase
MQSSPPRAASVVRAMPNTPALIGRGIAGLYARDRVTVGEKGGGRTAGADWHRGVGRARGRPRCGDRAFRLGAGPGVHMVEAMVEAARQMGLSPE